MSNKENKFDKFFSGVWVQVFFVISMFFLVESLNESWIASKDREANEQNTADTIASRDRATAAQDRATDAQIRNTDITNKTKLFIECKKNGWSDCERYNPYPKDTGIKKDNNRN